MIEHIAEKIIKELNIKEPPIEISEIANRFNYTIDYQSFKELDGYCCPEDKHIIVNKNLPLARCRFTAMHEASHIVLDHHKATYSNEDGFYMDNPKENKEASRLAAAVLMPKDMLLKELSRLHKEDYQTSLKKLAGKFNVSLRAMEKRLEDIIKNKKITQYKQKFTLLRLMPLKT